jgi:small subunit ribosomal protein S17
MAEVKTKELKTKKAKAPKAETTAVAAATKKPHKRLLRGIVVSDKMEKTCVVRVERQVQNGMYGKYITRSSKFKAHNEGNRAKAGDLVMIIESRPLSREKRWAVQKIIRAASGEVLNKA